MGDAVTVEYGDGVIEIITKAADWTFEQGWDGQQPILAPVLASQDAGEGARAFAEKRAPRWTGR